MSNCARCGYPIENTYQFVVLDDEVYCMGCFKLVSQFRSDNDD